MENFLQNRKKFDTLSPTTEKPSTVKEENFGQITANREKLPSVELEVPASSEGLTPPKVAYQVEDNRVSKIIVTCPDGQILTIRCEY